MNNVTGTEKMDINFLLGSKDENENRVSTRDENQNRVSTSNQQNVSAGRLYSNAHVNNEQPRCYSSLVHNPMASTTSPSLQQEVTASPRQQQDMQQKIEKSAQDILLTDITPNASSQEPKLNLCSDCVTHGIERDPQVIEDQRIVDAWNANRTDQKAIRDFLFFLFRKEQWSFALSHVQQALITYPQSEEFLGVRNMLLVITEMVNHHQQHHQQTFSPL